MAPGAAPQLLVVVQPSTEPTLDPCAETTPFPKSTSLTLRACSSSNAGVSRVLAETTAIRAKAAV
jgi:hypothetical protein